ncbi:MAG: hypothetical protein BK997_03320 [Candidatus Micrarchaeum sp. ARMAN-1]|jgi:hypothetical protein|nr:MAG: hypothetical protein BK997_03320 [Candidatus Micrarchaeum sp. ARMAN-1]
MRDSITAPRYSSALAARIKEFNSAFKLGIDLGTKTGGVALVKDNKVLLAKTFLDYHKQTLEERRIHRRNRRSRLARRKRIARLRSWILRQKIYGKQLPDPYKIKKMQLPNGVRKGENWIDLVVSGRDLSPEAFVRAITLIFQKRGQRYEEVAKEIEEMSYKEFSTHIKALTSVTEEEFTALAAEIERRQDVVDTDKEAERYTQLSELLSKVSESKSESKDRAQRKEDLGKVVNAFCSAHRIEDKDKWCKELMKLLDRPVRHARFLNKVLIRCNICDRATPKKSRPDVRELLYFDTVRNFLKAGRVEQNPDVISYYKKIYMDAEVIRVKILNKEKLTDEDKKQKRKLASELNRYKNKEYVTDAQKKMQEQLKTLLFMKLTGRSRYCMAHLKERAAGKDVEEGLHGVVQKRHDRNIAQRNHDLRVINLIESLLFDQNKSLSDAIRKNGLMYVTIEAPEPKTKHAKKGAAVVRDPRKLKEKLFDDQNGVCIYTGLQLDKLEISKYEKDHIFPDSRDGPSIRDNLVLTTKEINSDKGDRTPWEWMHDNPEKWKAFERRVAEFYKKGRINERKRELLLNKGTEYPGDNPTELARGGARVNNFITEFNDRLKTHGVQELQTIFERNKPIVQVVRGEETQRLRRQWNALNQNFIPLKDRAMSFNHAEDAAIAASMPPKFWREQIYRTAWHFGPSGNERPDFALAELAPQWNDFFMTKGGPIIAVLGKTKYSWKHSIIDDTIYKPFSKSAYYVGIYKKPNAITSNAIKVLRPKLLNGEHTMSKNAKYYHQKIGNERFLMKSQKGGSIITVKPHDGPEKVLQISPTYECAVLTKHDGKIIVKFKPIKPLRDMYARGVIKAMDKELETSLSSMSKHAKYKELHTHDIIYLPATKKHVDGYFIITKLSAKHGIKALPESMVKVKYTQIGSENNSEVKLTKPKPEITLDSEDITNIYNFTR